MSWWTTYLPQSQSLAPASVSPSGVPTFGSGSVDSTGTSVPTGGTGGRDANGRYLTREGYYRAVDEYWALWSKNRAFPPDAPMPSMEWAPKKADGSFDTEAMDRELEARARTLIGANGDATVGLGQPRAPGGGLVPGGLATNVGVASGNVIAPPKDETSPFVPTPVEGNFFNLGKNSAPGVGGNQAGQGSAFSPVSNVRQGLEQMRMQTITNANYTPYLSPFGGKR